MTMVNVTPFLPRIYSLDPQLAASPDVESHLDKCISMGFDHVLVPSRPGSANFSNDALRTLAKTCIRKGLNVVVDLDLGSIGSNSAMLERYPHWFVEEDDTNDLPDPRRPVRQDARRVLGLEREEVVREIGDYWEQTLQSWHEAGVARFRCMDIAAVPVQLWQRLIAASKTRHAASRFLAWTPGTPPEYLESLVGVGFDATFSSAAWWDYRSHWLVDEQARLNRIAPPISFPDSPDEPVISRLPGVDDVETRRRLYLRALRFAAATGNGILVPMGFESGNAAGQLESAAPMDLANDIAQANAFLSERGTLLYGAQLDMLSGAGSGVAILLRHAGPARPDATGDAFLIVANADATHTCSVNESELLERTKGFIRYRQVWPTVVDTEAREGDMQELALDAADLHLFAAHKLPPVLAPASRGKQAVTAAARCPRIAIESISPSVDNGRFPAKRTVGESVHVEADVFTDGHDKLAVGLLWRAADETDWHMVRMHPLGNDRWSASFPLTRLGRYQFIVEAWKDVFATYRDELEKKTTAGLNVSLELEEGRLLVEAAAAYAEQNGLIDTAGALKALARTLKASREKSKATDKDAERIAALLSEPTAEAMRHADARPFLVRSEPVMRVDAERTAARFSSWYELFPRSQSGDPQRHGTFDDVIKRLPAIQAMGFDTLYFPPIHPIGKKHRKGRNNSLTPGPEDPGSPYAIGAEAGGHDAIHPELGTLDDFRRLRDEAARHGLELALDFAIQCSPDHPWLKEHPDWFAWRPDGTIRYAENPPKKYQDIVNVDFYADGAVPGLWIALRDVVLFWVKEGVRVFRVDNPHTKPLPFWEWMIGEIRGRYPDTIFLSEAFTRPKMMYRLAKVGYSQSYTYFTWRHTKGEFIEYLTELSTTNVREYFRPHFFVNTPDINPYFLQRSGRPGFLIRAALATTLSGLWGMYSGFELCEGTPVPGKEEYLDSEKYEIRAWDWQRPGNIIHEITQLNRIRLENPALQTHLGIRFLNASNDNILYFIKATPPADSCQRFGDNVVLVAINLDPFNAHDTTLEIPLWEFGVPDDGALEVDDLISGHRVTWHGKFQQLRLDPFVSPYAIWRVRHKGG